MFLQFGSKMDPYPVITINLVTCTKTHGTPECTMRPAPSLHASAPRYSVHAWVSTRWLSCSQRISLPCVGKSFVEDSCQGSQRKSAEILQNVAVIFLGRRAPGREATNAMGEDSAHAWVRVGLVHVICWLAHDKAMSTLETIHQWRPLAHVSFPGVKPVTHINLSFPLLAHSRVRMWHSPPAYFWSFWHGLLGTFGVDS
jgi:hypothetical protein